jgi:ribosomal protein L16 Arg81 hydroxylase
LRGGLDVMMISDLRSLVDPLGETEFLTLLRERKLTFRPGSKSCCCERLLNWETLNHLLESATFPLQDLRVMRESVSIPTNFYLRQGRVDPAAITKLLDQGVSLVFNRLEQHVPALRTLCRNIARSVPERVGAAAIATSGRGGALEIHHDAEDLIILQIAGTKRWLIYGCPVINPVKGVATGQPPKGPPVFDRVLQPGDFLFLPAGYWHHCENGPHRSLHMGILFVPPNGRDLLAVLGSQLSSNRSFRRALARHGSQEALAEHEALLKAHLIETIQAMSLARFLTEHAASRQIEAIQLEGRTDRVRQGQA